MCLDCLACREACEHGIHIPSNLSPARVGFTRYLPPLVAEEHVRWDTMKAWQILREAAPAWRVSDDCQALLVPGRELLQEDCIPVLRSVFAVLDHVSDRTVGVNRDSVLECGHYPYAHAWYQHAMEEATSAFKRYGRYSRLVFASPHCASFVRLQWPHIDLDRSRAHTTLLEFVGKRLDFSGHGYFGETVVYHDPCHLSRHLGLYQLPRDLLQWATGSRPIEMVYAREKAYCCGGGYPVPAVAPEVAAKITLDRVGQFGETGASILVTGCGECSRRFASSAPDLDVRHIMQVLAEAKK